MKVLIQNQVSIDQVRGKIAEHFPNYTISMRNSKIIVVKKSGTAAALVMVRNGKITINEGFPSMGGQPLFTFCILLLGFLIPLIVYYAAFFPAQKAVRNEIGAFVQAAFV